MKILCVFLCLLLAFSGCSVEIGGAQLSNRLIIEAIGIDAKDGQFLISVLALHTQQSNAANSAETPDGIGKVYSAQGKSISEAFAQIDLISGLVPLYSQTRVLILGKEIAENAPMQALDFFIRNYTLRDNILLAVAQGTAAEIIKTDLGKTALVSKTVQDILESGKNNGLTAAVELYRFAGRMIDETDGAFLPVIKAQKNENDEQEITHAGIALFADGNLTDIIDGDTAKGLLWTAGLIENDLINIDFNGHTLSVAVKDCKSRIRIQNGSVPSVAIQIRFTCDLIEYDTDGMQIFHLQELEKINEIIQEQVQQYAAKFFETALRDNACDCLCLLKRLKTEQPEYYEQFRNDRRQLLKEIGITVTVHSEILKTGRDVIQVG